MDRLNNLQPEDMGIDGTKVDLGNDDSWIWILEGRLGQCHCRKPFYRVETGVFARSTLGSGGLI